VRSVGSWDDRPRALAPSQWDEGVRFHPDIGPGQAAAIQALRARVLPNLA
jgi:hypothetical protein